MIRAENLSFRYDGDWVLKNVSFSVPKGDFIGIVGPNGAGKTTLLKLLYRLIAPQRGQILIDGTDLEGMARKEISRRIAVVTQETHITFPFIALQVVLMGRSPHLRGLQFETKRDFDIAKKAMELTDTLRVSRRPLNELSGGEKQRVFIARALAQETDIIFFDEPTANMDIHHRIAFYDLTTSLNEKRRITMVMVSHDIDLAAEFCKNILLLHKGMVFALGKPEEVITKANIEAIYEIPVLVDKNPVTGAPRVTLLRRAPSQARLGARSST